jgi:glutamate-1-semialdehyde aminotransferase
MEAMMIEEPKNDFLQKVKDLSHKNGAILIFDEIVNGFRIAIGGAQEYYKVVPDLAAFGKGMANGMPISVIAGKKEIMREFNEVFFSFTFGGEVLSLAAAMATINVFKSNEVIKHFHVQGGKLKDGYNKLVKENGLDKLTGAAGLPEHSAIFFNSIEKLDSLIIKSLFQQELIKRGILTIGVQNICYSLNDSDINKTLEAYNNSLKILNKAIMQEKVLEYIEGGPISPIFKRW